MNPYGTCEQREGQLSERTAGEISSYCSHYAVIMMFVSFARRPAWRLFIVLSQSGSLIEFSLSLRLFASFYCSAFIQRRAASGAESAVTDHILLFDQMNS